MTGVAEIRLVRDENDEVTLLIDDVPPNLTIEDADIFDHVSTLEPESFDGVFFDPEIPRSVLDAVEWVPYDADATTEYVPQPRGDAYVFCFVKGERSAPDDS